MKVLAVDLGGKRTGFAISDPEGKMALALPTLAGVTPADVARVAHEQDAGEIVVGLPINMSGTLGPSAERVLAFVEELRLHTSVPVTTWDERLSTAEGEGRLRQAGFRRKDLRRRVDHAAALVILERYLGRPR